MYARSFWPTSVNRARRWTRSRARSQSVHRVDAGWYSGGVTLDQGLAETLRDLKRRRRAHDGAIKSLDLAIQGIERYMSHAAETDPAANTTGHLPKRPAARSQRTGAHRPSGKDAVARVLMDAAPHGMNAAELAQAMSDRGWAPESDTPERAARASANRLRRSDAQFVLENARFYYRPQSASSAGSNGTMPEQPEPETTESSTTEFQFASGGSSP